MRTTPSSEFQITSFAYSIFISDNFFEYILFVSI